MDPQQRFGNHLNLMLASVGFFFFFERKLQLDLAMFYEAHPMGLLEFLSKLAVGAM